MELKNVKIIIFGMKIGCSMTQSQQDFLNAVNDLHITIDKLNI